MVMDENEREFDRCPMYFNDGSDPYNVEDNHIRIFDFSDYSVAASMTSLSIAMVSLICYIHIFLA